MSASVISKGFDLAVLLIPGLRKINKLLKYGKKTKVHRLINGEKIRIKVRVTEYFSRIGIGASIARSAAGLIINGMLTIIDTSVGQIAVSVLKRFFKTYNKKAKKYIFWGKKVKVEYINFSKRK